MLFTPLFSYATDKEHFVIGVLSFDEKSTTLEKWTPLAAYLNQSLEGYTFEIQPLFFDNRYHKFLQTRGHGIIEFIEDSITSLP